MINYKIKSYNISEWFSTLIGYKWWRMWSENIITQLPPYKCLEGSRDHVFENWTNYLFKYVNILSDPQLSLNHVALGVYW